MIKRRFYKLEHGDKDSGSDSSCFSSDSDPEIEESEDSESESEDAVAQVSEEDDDSGEVEEESPAAGIESEDDADVDDDDDDDDDDDGYRGKTKTNREFHLEEPPEEEEENYILGCMIKINKVYKCRFCPRIMCLNEKSMEAHVASKKHAYLERLWKEENLSTDEEQVDDAEKPSQVKGNRRSQRKGKRSMKKLKTDDDEVDKSETPSLLIKGNRKARRQGLKPQKPDKMNIHGRESTDATHKPRKKRRQTKD